MVGGWQFLAACLPASILPWDYRCLPAPLIRLSGVIRRQGKTLSKARRVDCPATRNAPQALATRHAHGQIQADNWYHTPEKAVKPPSTASTVPVTNFEASASR